MEKPAYVDLPATVTPDTMRRLKDHHKRRVLGTDETVYFTDTVREVISAGLDIIEQAQDSTIETSPNRSEEAA